VKRLHSNEFHAAARSRKKDAANAAACHAIIGQRGCQKNKSAGEQYCSGSDAASDQDGCWAQKGGQQWTVSISRIEIQRNQLVVSVKPTNDTIEPEVLSIAWQKPRSKRARKILLPHGTSRDNLRPERAERRTRLVCAIARGRRWLDEIVNGSVTDAGQLAKRERCTVRQVNMTLSLAFLAPQLVKAAVEGRLPRGINIERVRDLPAEWGRQFEELGLDPD
jgi:hypothetical protein